MKRYKKLFVGILGVLVFALVCSMAFAAEEKGITGQITEKGLLVADDGAIYDPSGSGKSEQLQGMSGKKVIVKGTVRESVDNGFKIIEVTDYKVIE